MSDPLIIEINEAAAELGISAATLCARAVGNGHLPDRLASGGTVTVAVLARLRAYVTAEKQRSAEETAA
jgi:hypothetical protein